MVLSFYTKINITTALVYSPTWEVIADAGVFEATLGCAAAAGDCVEIWFVPGRVGKAALWAGASIISYTNPGITANLQIQHFESLLAHFCAAYTLALPP